MSHFHSTPPTLRLDVLLFQEDGAWIAHCLQLDLVTTGDDEDSAYDRAIDVCVEHVRFAFENNRLEHLFVPQDPVLLRKMFQARQEGFLRIVLGSDHSPELEFQRLAVAA